MIFPSQTSLIPIQIALARFWESLGGLGIDAFNQNYPYWYLGTTPFRYLTGPILPLVLVLIHRLVPNLSLFEIMFGVIGVSWVVGTVGVYWLVREMSGPTSPSQTRLRGTLAAVFYLLGPIVPFLFRFSDGLYLITFSFLPFALLLYLRLLRDWTKKVAFSLILAIAFITLLDSLIIPSLALGMGAVLLAQTGWKGVEEKLKRSLWLMAYGLLLATFWYTPGYWLTLLGAPSLAGKGLAGVIIWLGKLLPTALAFGIAVFSVRFFKKRNLLRDFCFYWLFIFGFLTLMRFISDPDFWLDWSSYGLELQLGLAVLGGLVVNRLGFIQMKANVKRIYANVRIGILIGVIGVSWLFLLNKYVIGTLQRDITQTVEYKISKQLSQTAKPGERVFLSGTTAFWLNAFFDIPQVRGGVDQASVDPDWRRAVWEIREGATTEGTEQWLKALNVSYLVVHTQDSEEYYHDFSHPEKFENIAGLKKIYDENGDRIYQILD